MSCLISLCQTRMLAGLGRMPAFAALAALTLCLSPFAHADATNGTTALSQAQLQAGVNNYMAQFPDLLAQTDAQLSPDAGRASGTAQVALELASDGRVLAIKIAQSSGNRLIDEFALADVGSAHYPAFNAEMPYKSLVFTVPVTVKPPPPSTPSDAPMSSGPDSAMGVQP